MEEAGGKRRRRRRKRKEKERENGGLLYGVTRKRW